MRWLTEAFFWFAAILPDRAVPAVGRGLGFLLHRMIRLRRRQIKHHLALAFPQFNNREQKILIRKVYHHFGMLLIELLRLPRQNNAQLRDQCVFEGIENLQAALAKKRGALILSGHLGNWELALSAAASHGFKVAAVTKEIKSPSGQYAVDRIREPHNVVAINRRRAIRPILDFLQKGGCVSFVLDQNMTESEGVFVDFFGRPACTMPGLAVLAKRYQVPVVPIFAFRDQHGEHRLRALPEVYWEEIESDGIKVKEQEVRHNTQRYTHILEQAIREHPEQWLWMHGRWRTRPRDEEETGKDPKCYEKQPDS